MTKTASKRIPGLPTFKERLLDNGAVERTVKIRAGEYRGHVLRFTKHSENRYTVYGLSALPNSGIVIERREHRDTVLLEDCGWLYTLRPEHQWIASKLSANSYYGVMGVGATPEEAYRNTFDRFRPGWPA
jgi:hypothetical protein